MGISIEFSSMFALGFALHFDVAIFELVLGPMIITIGDLQATEDEDD